MTTFQKLEQLVRDSSLNADAQDEVLGFLGVCAEENLRVLVELLPNHPDLVQTIYQNWKDKEMVRQIEDAQKWNEILKAEEQVLEKLSVAS